VLASLNAIMQLFLPGWVRARGLATYQVVFIGGQGLAAFGWGVVALRVALPAMFLVARRCCSPARPPLGRSPSPSHHRR
jgi:hypothetical protein